jgi:polar amino acid transport system substrate-binding protein
LRSIDIRVRALCAGLLYFLLTTSGAFSAELVVGANVGNVPWEFQNAQGDVVGFEIDLVREIAARLDMSVEIVNIPFNGLFSAVQSGRIDIAVSSITITEKRLGSVAFVQPYYDSAQSLTVSNGSAIAGLDDMRGKVVGVDTGSTGDIWSTANQTTYGFGNIRRFEGLVPAMLDVQTGRLDGYISDIPALEYFIKDKPYFKIVQRIETGEKYSMMLAKNDRLAVEVNDVISELKRSGYLAALHSKWFGTEPAASSSTVTVLDRPEARSVGIGDAGFVDTFLNWGVMVTSIPLLLTGLRVTLLLGAVSIVAGLTLGLFVALVRLYAASPASIAAKIYIDVFRSIPILVLLIIVYYAPPFIGLRLSPFMSAACALTLVSGAYTAEIFRAGIEAIPVGQFEASHVLGLSYRHMMVDVILPQATRIVIPPLTNNCINVIKDTALASVVAMPDLLKQATQAQALEASPTPLIVAALMYVALLWPLVILVGRLEKRFQKGRR